MEKQLDLKNVSYEWLEMKKMGVKKSTVVKYRWIIENQIIPFFNQYNYDNLDEKKIICFLNDMITKRNYSYNSVSLLKITLMGILHYSEKKYNTKHYDFSYIKLPSKKIEVPILTSNQEKNINSYINTHDNFIAVAIGLGLYAGLRVGEVCGLTWEDVNFDEGTLKINRTIQRLKVQNKNTKTQLIESEPKTISSKRTVVIPDFFMEYLIKHKGINKNKKCYVITNDFDLVDPRKVQYHFNKVCASYDFHINFHALRHTYATNCVKLDIDIKTISEMLGHSSVTITLNRYVHSNLEFQKQQINKMKRPF